MFADFYLAKHNGRKLTWQTNMGTADLRAVLGGKTRELVVTTQQMLLLLQFNQKDTWSFTELQVGNETQLPQDLAEIVNGSMCLSCAGSDGFSSSRRNTQPPVIGVCKEAGNPAQGTGRT